MDIESLRLFGLRWPLVTEGMPFGEGTLVLKVAGKIFLMISLDEQPARFNFKAEPQHGLEYRERFSAVIPGYHSNKRHWNTVRLDGSVPDEILKSFIENSYRLVAAKLPLKIREEIKNAGHPLS